MDPLTGEKKLVQLGSPRRLKTIYDANKRSSKASATWQRAQATKQFAPYFIYELGPSQKHREEHKGWQGKIRPIDDPFWNYAMPPNAFGCKCFVTQITKARAEKLGGVSPIESLEFQNKTINGVDIKYLKGVDPAWSSNSGKFRNKVLSETLANKKQVHADTLLNEYKMVQDIVSTGTYNKAKQVYYKKINGKYYLVSVKITKNNELIMTSFYRITEAQVKDMNK